MEKNAEMSQLVHPHLYISTGTSGTSLFQLLFGAHVTRNPELIHYQLHFPGALGTAVTSSTRENPLPDDIERSIETHWGENPFNYRLAFGPRALSDEGIFDLACLSKSMLGIFEAYALTVVRGDQECLISAGKYQEGEEIYDRTFASIRDKFIPHMINPAINPFLQVYDGVIPLGQTVSEGDIDLDIQ